MTNKCRLFHLRVIETNFDEIFLEKPFKMGYL